MTRTKSIALAVALALGFSHEASARGVAMMPTEDQAYVIVLTDEFADVCPIESNAAVIYSVERKKVEDIVLGCWAYDKPNDEIRIFWMNSMNKDTYVGKYPASKFILIQNTG